MNTFNELCDCICITMEQNNITMITRSPRTKQDTKDKEYEPNWRRILGTPEEWTFPDWLWPCRQLIWLNWDNPIVKTINRKQFNQETLKMCRHRHYSSHIFHISLREKLRHDEETSICVIIVDDPRDIHWLGTLGCCLLTCVCTRVRQSRYEWV